MSSRGKGRNRILEKDCRYSSTRAGTRKTRKRYGEQSPVFRLQGELPLEGEILDIDLDLLLVDESVPGSVRMKRPRSSLGFFVLSA